ncbi:MAG: hypothetical protein SFX18_19975 [Pirellulales bacterium]|nr:hypothetical protein [Pirellulales bacterium]
MCLEQDQKKPQNTANSSDDPRRNVIRNVNADIPREILDGVTDADLLDLIRVWPSLTVGTRQRIKDLILDSLTGGTLPTGKAGEHSATR